VGTSIYFEDEEAKEDERMEALIQEAVEVIKEETKVHLY